MCNCVLFFKVIYKNIFLDIEAIVSKCPNIVLYQSSDHYEQVFKH